MISKRLILPLALASGLFVVGCTHPIVGAPAVSQAALTAEDSAQAIANGLKLAQDAAKTAQTGGVFSASRETSIDNAIKAVAVKDGAFLEAAHTAAASGNGTWQAEAQALVAAAKTITPATLGISSAGATANFYKALASIQTLVAIVAGSN